MELVSKLFDTPLYVPSNLATKGPTLIAIISQEFVAQRFSSVYSVELKS